MALYGYIMSVAIVVIHAVFLSNNAIYRYEIYP